MRRRLLRGFAAVLCPACGGRPSPAHPECDAGNGGLTLPAGFCAAVFADGIGIARHLVLAADGTLYVAMEDRLRTSAGTSKQRTPGGVMILRDTTGDGRADFQRLRPRYETFADGFAGGHLDPGRATHRPVGLAEGPDGALYITDDQRGRVWAVHDSER